MDMKREKVCRGRNYRGFKILILLICICSVCTACSSERRGVPKDQIYQELGILAEKTQQLNIHHKVNTKTHIDTVTIEAEVDNRYVRCMGNGKYQYQYLKANDLWVMVAEGEWNWDRQLKDFMDGRSKPYIRENFINRGSERIYYCLEIYEVDTEKNTINCEYYVEIFNDEETLLLFKSEGIETINTEIVGGAAYITVDIPKSERMIFSQSVRLWLNEDDKIDSFLM